MENMISKVMFIDDDQDQCDLVESVLSGQGYNIKCFTCPTDALSSLEVEQFSVIITDMCMDKMNGIDLCRIITDKYRNIPVIILTGYACLTTALHAIDAGAKEFLTKPFELFELNTVIEKVLS